MVHKAHCKKMSLARQQSEETVKEPVGIYSHHPFPDPEAAGVQSGSADTTEVLVALVQRFLMQIKSMMDPALFLHIEQLPQLEDVMEMNRRKIWAHRKLYPEQYKDADILDGFSASYRLFPNTKVFAPGLGKIDRALGDSQDELPEGSAPSYASGRLGGFH